MKAALPPLINPTDKILILGSMPGEQSLKLQEYYGNRGNHFWKLMFTVFHEPFNADYTSRKQFLVRNGIALWDVLAHCERKGSLDSNIKNEVPNDFQSFHLKYPNIQYVFFSSKAASKYYDKYAQRINSIEYFILASPSGANAGKTFLQKLDEWKILSTI